MIDTIKLLIPIEDRDSREKLKSRLIRFRKEDLSAGRIHFEFFRSNVKLGSFNRTIALKSTEDPLGFFIEFSVPKYAKGNNVEMIYPHDLITYFDTLLSELSEKLEFALPHYSTWIIYKLDICYNWFLQDKAEAEYAMHFLQRIDFPRKKKYNYDTSVMFIGSAYTIKFYLKGPEFLKNDFKEIPETQGHNLIYEAEKIVRYEIGFRREYLEKILGKETVYLQDVADDSLIENLLKDYLEKKIFRYLTNQSITEAKVEEVLDRNFTKRMSMTLFLFYKSYYFDPSLKRKMLTGGANRSTIYRHKKLLKKVGIGSDLSEVNTHILEKLVIPSPDTKFVLTPKEYIIKP